MRKKNKFVVLVLLVVVLVCGGSLLFKSNYKKDINKILKEDAYSYLSPKAKKYIKSVYEKTGKLILTEKNKRENTPYLNPKYIDYLDLNEQEKKEEGSIPVATIVDYSSSKMADNVSLPTSYDLRNVNGKNYVTPVRDQGNLGICWTFASAGITESYLLKQNDLSYQPDSELISERQIDYATSVNGIKDYASEYVSFIDRNLGEGGNFYISSIAMANGISLIDYSSFKEFNDKDLEPMELNDILSYKNSLYELNSTINMPNMSFRESTGNLTEEQQEIRKSYINEVKTNIMKYGAAYVSTYISNACLVNTGSDDTILDVYKCKGDGHAMEIIGWDDNKEYEYCADTDQHSSNIESCKKIVKGNGAWLLKNSWGDDTPYLYLTYDSLNINISYIKEINSSKNRNWDNNYFIEIANNSNEEYSLSNTNINKEEKLKKIKFIGETNDTTYTIRILKSDGNYETITKNVEMPGLLTIDINNDVIINKNSKIYIKTDGDYIDKVSIFTENIDDTFYIDLSKYADKTFSDPEIRLYSNTKNIPSGSIIDYKIYDEDNNDLSGNISYSNNIVAENNINTLFSFKKELNSGSYRLDVLYNSTVIGSINFKYSKMAGSGTKKDPYVIKNSSHLNQIRDDLDAYYILANDIDLTNDTRKGGKFYNQPKNEYAFLGGHGWKIINEFSGTLDGKGHKIKGLYQKSYLYGKKDDITYNSKINGGLGGLFGKVYDNAEIKNLTLEDFDITCGGYGYNSSSVYCGILLASYDSTSRVTGGSTGNFKNIFIKNSKLNLDSGSSTLYAGGVFGTLNAPIDDSNYKINISNIYVDLIVNKTGSGYFGGYLANSMSGYNIDIKNVRMLGKRNYKESDINSNRIIGVNVNVSNVFSSVYDNNFNDSLIDHIDYSTFFSTSKVTIKNINLLKIPNKELFSTNDDSCKKTIENVNQYELGIDSYKLSDKNNYNNWDDFNNDWNIETVDGISRYPVLKGIDFDYTKIDDISINQTLNKEYNLYNYLYPKTESAKRITFKSKDENIVKIEDDGKIIPQGSGDTTIHVESMYDGYIKDVPISIEYTPHYTVLFDSNGGTGNMNSVEVASSKDYKIDKNIFTKEKYNFIGWNTKADGTGASYDDLSVIKGLRDKEQITLYAQWRGEKYEISFDADGGNTPIKSKIVYYGEEYGELPVPIKSGYGFEGWKRKIDSNIVTSVKPNSIVYAPTNLIANWKQNAYTVAFNPNGGIGYTKTYAVAINSDYKLETNAYLKDGYKFSGWNTKADGTGTSYNNCEVINLSNVENSQLMLYAQWISISYKVIFNSNDSKNIVKEQIILSDEPKKLNKNSFVKDGYEFKNWNTKADGTGTSYEDGQEIIDLFTEDNNEVKLYAQWMPISYKIKFNPNEGKGSLKEQIFTYDISIKLNKNVFTRDGYEFKNWNTKADGSGTSYEDEQEILNLTKEKDSIFELYAQWKETFDFKINKYSYDDINKYIDLIEYNTTVSDFQKNITLNSGYSIVVDFKEINGKNVLFTGGKTKIFKDKLLYKELTNIVRGDVNGNGKIDIIDYIRIKKDIMDDTKLNGEYKKAADMNQNNKIDIIDYIRIKKIIMEVE